MTNAQPALDTIDQFIAVGKNIAALPLMRQPGFEGAADAIYRIAGKLLRANENMARWLNRFARFDFHQVDAGGRFLALAGEYETAKAGGQLREMKFHCGEISIIYWNDIYPRLAEMLSGDTRAIGEVDRVFTYLGSADADMVAFIYETVVRGIDGFREAAERCVDNGQIDYAEGERLRFRVASGELSERLERLATGLSDLVLQFAALARRPVDLGEELVDAD
jgi:hypothetical protein